MFNFNDLSDKIGVTLGEFPRSVTVNAFRSLPYHRERELENIGSIDYFLLDSRCLMLSNVDFVLTELSFKLKDHGLLYVFQPPEFSASVLFHKILLIAGMELLGEELSPEGTFFLFRLVRPKPVPVTAPKPLRYKVADFVNNILPIFSYLKRRVRLVFKRT